MSIRLFTTISMAQGTQLNHHARAESGGVAVEAAVGIPFFLAITFTSLQLLVFCFQLLSFQYQVSSLTTNVFLSPSSNWRSDIETGVAAIGNGLGLCPGDTSECEGNSTWGSDVVTIEYLCAGSTEGTQCGAITAQSGDLARVTVIFTKPIFKVLDDLGIDPLTLRVSAISGIMRTRT